MITNCVLSTNSDAHQTHIVQKPQRAQKFISAKNSSVWQRARTGKFVNHCCLPSFASMRDVRKMSLLHAHTLTVYTSTGGKDRCSPRCDPWAQHAQTSKSAGMRTTLALKPNGEGQMKTKIGLISGTKKGLWSNKKKKR